jgi:Ca2+-binding EF-hand superfamily protein
MRAYKVADRNEDGFIKRNEFLFFLRCIIYNNNLWKQFDAIDKNHDRRLSRQEFVRAATGVKGIEDPVAVFKEIDSNRGGYILFDEFCEYMARADAPDFTQSINSSAKSRTPGPRNRKPAVPPHKDISNGNVPDRVMKIKVPSEEECNMLFDQIDKNGNGILSMAERDKAVVEIWPELNNKSALMRANRAVDRDSDGFIKKSEFGFFLRFVKYYNNLWRQFDAIDKNHDRRLSRQEFVKAAAVVGGIEDPVALFKEIDANRFGYILFEGFCSYMGKTDAADFSRIVEAKTSVAKGSR